jgi:hypothetical protein
MTLRRKHPRYPRGGYQANHGQLNQPERYDTQVIKLVQPAPHPGVETPLRFFETAQLLLT